MSIYDIEIRLTWAGTGKKDRAVTRATALGTENYEWDEIILAAVVQTGLGGDDDLTAEATATDGHVQTATTTQDGGAGNDRLTAAAYVSGIWGGTATTTQWGGDGHDTLVATATGDLSLGDFDVSNRQDGGNGNDLLTATATLGGGGRRWFCAVATRQIRKRASRCASSPISPSRSGKSAATSRRRSARSGMPKSSGCGDRSAAVPARGMSRSRSGRRWSSCRTPI